MQLFRQQALDHQHRLHGEVFMVPPLRWQAIGWLLLGLVATLALVLSLGSHMRMVGAPGTLVQDARGWQAQLAVPAGAVARIERGQPVRVTLAARPDQGALQGIVERIGLAPMSDAAGAFAVTVRLDPASAPLPLRPGLAVQARIMLGRESLWRLLLGPLTTGGRR